MAAENTIRKLPFSLDAEQSVLGSILIDPEALNEITSLIGADDFYLKEHQEIYSAMQKLFQLSRTIDPVTLMDALVKEGVYNAEESKNYIRTLAEIVPYAANVKDYAKIVRDKSLLRKLIASAGEISEKAYAEQERVSDIISFAENLIYKLAKTGDQDDLVHIQDVLLSTYKHIKDISDHRGEAMGIPTGFAGLDSVLVGMGNGNLIIIGARPAMGKTTFAMNLVANVAKQTPKAVCVFSLEMNNVELGLRMLSSEGLVANNKLKTGFLDQDDWDKLAHASEMLLKTNIYVDQSTGITVSDIKSKLRRLKNVGLVVIDHLGLLRAEGHNKNEIRSIEVGNITRDLKILAKDMDIPVICCAQLNRQVTQGSKDHRPQLSDLRESGSIEQDADVVLFLHREVYYDKDPAKENQAEIIIAKNRHGSTGNVEMNFLKDYTLFTAVDRQGENG